MDLNVELPNGMKKTVPVPVSCTLQKAVELIGMRTGLCRKPAEMEEFSLAWKDDNSDTFINVSWLNPQMPLSTQGVGGSRVLLLRKKYFVKNNDLDGCINSVKTSVMLETIYAQLRQSFVAGLYGCTAFQAAQIAGMAALVEYSSSMVRNPQALRKIGLIKKILPEKFWSVKGIENQIAKGIEDIRLTEVDAMKAFISRLRKLETFGASFFTINLSPTVKGAGTTGLLGIGPQYVYKMEVEALEPLEQWYTEDIVTFSSDGDMVHLQFGEEMVDFTAEDCESIMSFLGGYKKQLNTEEAKVVIQRSRSRRQSRADLESPSNLEDRILQEVPVVDRSWSPLHASTADKATTDPPSPLKAAVQQTPQRNKVALARQQPVRKQPRGPEKVTEQKPAPSEEQSPPVPPRTASLEPRSPESEKKTLTAPSLPLRSEQPPPSIEQKSPMTEQHSPQTKQHPPQIVQHSPQIVKKSRIEQPSPQIEKHSPQIVEKSSKIEQRSPQVVQHSPQIEKPPSPKHKQRVPTAPETPRSEEKSVQPEELSSKTRQGVQQRVPAAQVAPVQQPEKIVQSLHKVEQSQGSSSNSPVFDVVRRNDPCVVSSSEENLETVAEEGEEKQLSSIPGSPQSLSPDSFRCEEDRRAENEKKFDTLTKQSTNKALHGRKERLKALKKKKDDGKLSANEMAELKAVSDVKRRASKKAKEVSKYISMPPQSGSDYGSLDELNELFDLDLTKQRWSQEINPIYDYTAATEAESLLTSSDVTYEDPMKMFTRGRSAPPNNGGSSNGTTRTKKKSSEFPVMTIVNMEDVKQAQAQVDSIYSRAFSPAFRSGSSTSNGSKESGNGDLDTGVYGLVGVNKSLHDEEELYQVPTTQLDDNFEEDIYRCMDSMEVKTLSDSDREKSPSPTVLVPPHPSNPHVHPSPGIGKRRLIKGGSLMSVKSDKISLAQVKKAPVEPLKDFGTLKREFRVFYVKLPIGDVVHEMVNLNEFIHKVISRLCALIGSKEPSNYNLTVEGSVLTSMKEPQSSIEGNEAGPKGKAMIDPLGIRSAAFAYLTEQGDEPIELDREKSFRDHGIHTSRILALRFVSDKVSPEMLPHQPLRVPPPIRFHQCWLSVVQGIQPCSQEDAIKLAALQYQTYFLDRTEHLSTTAHCTAAQFLPVEYSSLRNIEEKVLKEQQILKGYSRRQAQDSYIHDLCTLPTYKAVFFPVKEPRKRFFQNTKLMPMLLGVCKTGVMRVDPKSKEILDFWEYRIVRNWAYTTNTFLLAFDKQNYPVQTNQGKWINSLVEFFVSAIFRKDKSPTPELVKEGSPFHQPRKKLSVNIPSQEEVNAIYGHVTENGEEHGRKETPPLCTPV